VIVGSVGAGTTTANDPTVDGVADYTSVGTIDAFSVGTTSCNIGNANLLWQAGTVNHPVIPQNLYRYKVVGGAGRFEQIGQSWMKHAFTALTQNLCGTCNGRGGSVLGVGCSDPYTPTRNGEQVTTVGGLGPRFQVNPHKGDFIFPYMFRNTSVGIGNTSISRRLQVQKSDMDPAQNPGARFFFECQYVTPDDADNGNQDNNASYKEGTVSGSGGGEYSATMVGFATQRMKPAINAWAVVENGVTEQILNTPEVTGDAPAFDSTGRAVLSAKATDLGGGMWRYEYALYNMNSDRAFKGFQVPVGTGAAVTNIGFHDVPYQLGDGYNSTTGAPTTFDGTDWPGVYAGGNVSWDMVVATPAENSNALRWGTLYNFRFDCNRAPTSGNATLTMFKTSATLPNTMPGATVVPTPGVDCIGDADGDNDVDADDLTAVILQWGNTCPCTADVDDDNDVDADDLVAVVLGWGPCK
jgi:hypothetical protein